MRIRRVLEPIVLPVQTEEMREETTDGTIGGTIGEMTVVVAMTGIGEMIGAVLIGERREELMIGGGRTNIGAMIGTGLMTEIEEETIGMRGGTKGIETEVTTGIEEDMTIDTIVTTEGETIDVVVVDTRRRREMIETGDRTDKGMEAKTREGEKTTREARRRREMIETGDRTDKGIEAKTREGEKTT